MLGHKKYCLEHYGIFKRSYAKNRTFRTTSLRPPLPSSAGRAPASGQAPDDRPDGTAAGESKKTVRMGVPAAKIDGRLTDRFVVVSYFALLEKILLLSSHLHRCTRLELVHLGSLFRPSTDKTSERQPKLTGADCRAIF